MVDPRSQQMMMGGHAGMMMPVNNGQQMMRGQPMGPGGQIGTPRGMPQMAAGRGVGIQGGPIPQPYGMQGMQPRTGYGGPAQPAYPPQQQQPEQ